MDYFSALNFFSWLRLGSEPLWRARLATLPLPLSPPPQIRIMGKVGHWAVSRAQPPPLTLLSGLISSRGISCCCVKECNTVLPTYKAHRYKMLSRYCQILSQLKPFKVDAQMIYVCKMSGLFNPPLSCTEISWFCFLLFAFWGPPPSVDIKSACPLCSKSTLQRCK